ncbi:MAG: radical SAM protein [Candidatus Omnitrophica bacterium]|nr:radical SAM protein [Candidatus Omnitrophota bacterium]
MKNVLINQKPNVSFNWDIHYVCNYRCPYCWFYGKWQEMAQQNKYPSLDKILKVWKNIYDRYGQADIELIGGEPLIYPNIIQLVKGLTVFHRVGVTTNLSVEINDFTSQIDSSRVHIKGSFHPAFADFNKFLQRAVLLKEKGFGDRVAYVAYPPQIKSMEYYFKAFRKCGIQCEVLTFWGQYRGIKYPSGYTDEERKIIEPYLGTRQEEKFQLAPKAVKGRLCRAGQVYADIKADGAVFTCGGDNPQVVGNLFNDDFKLWDDPQPCQSETCPCNEWAGLLIKDAEPVTAGVSVAENTISVDSEEIRPQKNIDRSLIIPHRVFLTWDIHYGCNYQCTYCNTPKPGDPPEKWDKNRDKIVYPPIDKLLEIWQDIYNRYGSCEVHITGGEPFVYPSFLKLIHFLAKIHTLEIITNLSGDPGDIIKAVTADRVRIGTTFHPEFVALDEFLRKHKILRNNGFETWANYVAYPPQMPQMAGFKKEFDKLGIPFNMQPYMGFLNDKEYPAAYSDQELFYLKGCYDNEDIVNTKTVEWKTGTDYKQTRGRLCRMGQMYAKIYPNGDAYRCCGPHKKTIGNLFDGTFKLLDEALPCDCEPCFCWRCMLVEKEQSWAQHWVVPENKILNINNTSGISQK